MSDTNYCTVKNLQDRLSADGVALRTDDEPPGYLGSVVDEASATIDEYCGLQYDPVQMATSRIVKHWCADIAVMRLCERRGNPPPSSVEKRYDKLMERLELVRLGQLPIYGLPVRRTAAPVMSNLRVRLDPEPRVVVERRKSTGHVTDYHQNVDTLELPIVDQ